MPYLSKEQIAAAREMDLLTYLRRFEPEELVHIGGDTYATRTHDSLKISNGKWCWWSRGIGGTTALDYLTMVEGGPFWTPCSVFSENRSMCRPNQSQSHRSRKLNLPSHPNTPTTGVFLHICGAAALTRKLSTLHQARAALRDAERHNCVFVGYKHGTPAYGALRGTLSDTTFTGEVPGSDKRFSFAVPLRAGGKTLCVFESAIDALSYLTLLKLRGQEWRAANTLSLSGIYQPRKDGSIRFPAALEQYLKDNPGVARIVLCLDNDGPGRAASAAIQKRLSEYEVIDNPPRRGKDYNDQLQLVKGINGKVKTRGGEAADLFFGWVRTASGLRLLCSRKHSILTSKCAC